MGFGKHRQLFVILFFFFSYAIQAQLQSTVIGDAINQGNNCFTITPDQLNQAGGVWFSNPIDFDEDFTIYYQNNFGTKDGNGADGMALVFKGTSFPEIGQVGGGMGYDGITNSLIIEFDTFQNNDPGVGTLGDPSFDHIAINRDGNPSHIIPSTALTQPVQASSSSTNIEDGVDHEVKIVWNAFGEVLEVYFDCILRESLNIDIKNVIFNGDDTVFFFFLGSTGGLSNLHQVCFNSISFVDDLQLQDETVCDGDFITVDATVPSGDTYSWSPTTGVGSPNSPVTIISPPATTTYTVTILDNCGESSTEDITITVQDNEDPVFDDVPQYCSGDSIPALPTTSNNGISGTWSPPIDNTQTTTYTFTPNDGECGTVTTLEIIVNPLEIPSFNAVSDKCEGDVIPDLPTTSNNGISGTWSPPIDNTQTTTYTFTPNADECAEVTTLEIVINPTLTPNFDAEQDYCIGDIIPELPTTSTNGISGSWSPPMDNTQTTTYTFTPNDSECAVSTTLEISVEPVLIPEFDDIGPFCSGDAIEPLPTTSTNGINGTWSPEINNTQTTTYTFTPNDGECGEVTTLEIEIIDTFTPVFDVVTDYCIGDDIDPLPTTSIDGITGVWSPDINNTDTTTYTFLPDPDQGCAIETILTIEIDQGTIPEFFIVESICEGDVTEALPTVSDNGFTGSWSPELNNLETTTYTFTPDDEQCALETDVTITVNPVNEIELGAVVISEPFDPSIIVQLNVIGGNDSYEYRVNGGPWQTSNTFSNLPSGTENLFEARQINGCSNIASDTATGLTFPQFFTPNGYGFNEFWNIKGLRNQSDAVIYIFDRYGKLLVQILPTQAGWDGYYKGKPMPSQDYWFRVEFNDLVTGNRISYNNHFTLKR